MKIIESFNTLFFIYNRILNQSCKMDGYDELTVNNYQYIIAIYEAGKITTTELSNVLGLKKSSVTQMIQSLIEKDYVTKTKNELDKRSSFIELTSKSLELMKSEEKIYRYLQKTIDEALSENEQNELDYLLKKVIKEVDK